MIYKLIECECGEEIEPRRWDLGYRTCMECGEQEAKLRKHTIVPMNKSNYILVTDMEILKQLNPKRTT